MANTTATLSAALGGRYRIERELGAGGMASVFLAHDLKHDRQVAIKVLRSELAVVLGVDRFLAEIRTIAQLQHPHILGLIDSGQLDGTAFYVMPYVAGESLRDRLHREKQLPVDDAVRIAREVALALDYAHRQGVIHRDIKPENILLQDGQAMIADFGIALAANAAGEGRLTETGISLGTPHYMSPEQAMGERALTPPSDVYSLGCVLYELLAGEPPFSGPTAQAIVAKTMTSDPAPLGQLRRTVPAHVDAVVRTALQKVRGDRFKSALEFAEALAGRGTLPTTAQLTAPAPRRAMLSRVAVPAGVGAAALVLGLWMGGRSDAATTPTGQSAEFVIELDSGAVLRGNREYAISPDGRRIAYHVTKAGATGLYVRDLDDPVARLLPGTEAAISPFFSPDGLELLARDGPDLLRMRIDRGMPNRALRLPGELWEAEWMSGDTVLASVQTASPPVRLYVVALGAGTVDVLEAPDSSGTGHSVLPDSQSIVFHRFRGDETPDLMTLNLRTRQARALGARGYSPRYVTGGYLLYVDAQFEIVLRPFDASAGSFRGPPRRIGGPIRNQGPVASVFASATGSVVYEPAVTAADVLEVDRSGNERLVFREDGVVAPKYSPSGSRIAYTSQRPGDRRALWVRTLGDSSATRLSPTNEGAVGAAWSPDERFIATSFPARGEGVDLVAPDGSGTTAPLNHRGSLMRQPTFAGAGTIIYVSRADSTNVEIFARSLGPDSTPRQITIAPSFERMPAVTPDGRWLAFQSDRSGTREVYVSAFPGPGKITLVSAGGGTGPQWSPRNDGELFYRNGNRLISVRLDLTGEPRVTSRRVLFERTYDTESWDRNYDVHPDGNRFLFVRSQAGRRLHVIVNATARAAGTATSSRK